MMALRSIARTYREAFSGIPRDVWLLCLAALVNRAGTMVLPFIALFLTRDRGFVVIEAGRLIGLYGLGSLAGSYLGGWLSDRVGSIRTQQASLIAAGAGYLWILQVDRPDVLAASIVLTSIAAEALRPAVMTAVAHRAPRDAVARSFALLRLAVNLGMAIGPAVGGLLATYSYSLLFLGDALTSWLAALLLYLMLSPRRAGAPEEAAAAGPARSPWDDRPFLLLTGIVALLALCFFQVFSTLPIYLRQTYGLRENIIGPLIGLNALTIVLFEMVLIHRVERGNRLAWIGVGAFLVCGGLALLPLGRSVIWAVVSTLVWTLGEMLSLPLMNAVVADRAAPASRGRYMGIYTMAFSAAFVVAPVGGTWVFERLGPDVLWLCVGLLGIPLWLGSAVLSRAFRRASEPAGGARVARDQS